MNRVLSYIDKEFNRYIKDLQIICQQPSISQEKYGIEEMVSLLMDYMKQFGIKTKKLSVPGSLPFIYGEIKGQSVKSLLFYNHYDVQPVDPIEEWVSEPFAAEVREGKLYGRGVADNKGCLLSRIQAIEAWIQETGELPITIKFFVEGEEEIGSPHMVEFVKQHQDILKADACVWEYTSKNEDDVPTMRLGNKGMCLIELTAYGADSDIHSMYAPILSNPSWELAWALSTLKNREEDILIQGFYDDVEEITTEETEVLHKLNFNKSYWEDHARLNYPAVDLDPKDIGQTLFSEPTCNINGIVAGFTEEGVKTIIPSRATAKLDIRLVPNQDPLDIFEKVKKHLENHGFDHIEAFMLGYFFPSKTPVTSPFVNLVAETGRHIYGQEMSIEPTSPGSGPRYAFTTWTDMPIVALGVGYVGSQIHAPNENIRLEDYRQGIKHIAALIGAFGEGEDEVA